MPTLKEAMNDPDAIQRALEAAHKDQQAMKATPTNKDEEVYSNGLRICNVEYCRNKHLAKGLCSRHYNSMKKHGRLERITEPHGMYGTPEYNVWTAMKQRCLNPRDASYYNYGARGISICDEWTKSFKAFYMDMGKRPGSQYSLDRVNNDGNYEPSNCRWTTRAEQANNTRKTRHYKGKTRSEWAALLGVDPGTYRARAVKKGDKDAVEYYAIQAERNKLTQEEGSDE